MIDPLLSPSPPVCLPASLPAPRYLRMTAQHTPWLPETHRQFPRGVQEAVRLLLHLEAARLRLPWIN